LWGEDTGPVAAVLTSDFPKGTFADEKSISVGPVRGYYEVFSQMPKPVSGLFHWFNVAAWSPEGYSTSRKVEEPQ
jgi:hypothetical protein